MACLFLLKPYLHKITVYWVNAGDEFQETKKIIDHCKAFIPHFIEIKSDSQGWRDIHGVPSDLVPTYSSEIGRMLGFGSMKVSDRFSCCFNNLMLPMHQRMKSDGITCIIRGQKLVDMPTVPLKSGDSIDGFEFYYPIEEWTNEDVFSYLKEVKAPIHPCYEFGEHGANCTTCTAWWNESQHQFRKAIHPDIHAKVMPVMAKLRQAIAPHINNLFALD